MDTNVEFLKLKSGSNKIRVITQPYQYLAYYKNGLTMKKFYNPDDFYSLYGHPEEFRNYANNLENDKPLINKLLVGVIDRKDQKVKILDCNTELRNAITGYAKNLDRRDPREYDIDIQIDKNTDPCFQLTLYGKEPYSSDDLKKVKSFDLDCLLRLCDPTKSFFPSIPWNPWDYSE